MTGLMEMRYIVTFLTFFFVPQITWAAFCGEDATGKGSFTYFARKCPGRYDHPDPHKEAIQRLVAVSVAVQEAQRERAQRFEVEPELTGRPAICDSFLNDLLSLTNLQVLHHGDISWRSINRGSKTLNLAPGFNEWHTNGKTIVVGHVVVRWRNTETFLIRLQRQCSGSDEQQRVCQKPVVGFFNVHDSTSEKVACFFRRG